MLRILLVDDEELLCKGMKIKLDAALADVEHQCEYVLGGGQAVEFSREYQPDIAIVDIKMPGMNGMDTLSAVRAVSPDTVFLALSAYDGFNFVREMFVLGAVDYLLKPVSIADVRASVDKAREVLRRHEDEAASQRQNELFHLLADAETMDAAIFIAGVRNQKRWNEIGRAHV